MGDDEVEFPFEDRDITWKEFQEEQGSRFLQNQSTILKEHGQDTKTLFYKVLGSTNTLIQTVGVVAGFGFTGLGYVQNIGLFVMGELLLLTTIFVGLAWTQKVYRNNLTASKTAMDRVDEAYSVRFPFFKKIYDKALTDIKHGGKQATIKKMDMADLQQANNTLHEKLLKQEAATDLGDPIPLLMWLFAVGGVLVLLSFIRLCWLY